MRDRPVRREGDAARETAAARSLIPAILRRHRSASRCASSSARGGPSNTISPFDMPTMRSAKRRASSTLWMLTIDRDVALAGALRDQLHDLDRGFRIERGGRLVGEHQIGLLHQRARDADALALAAGELVGALGGEVAEPDGVEQLEGAVDIGGRKLAQPGAPHRHIAEPAAQHVLDHREPLDQIVFLEHHADAPARHRAIRGRASLARSWPRNMDLARGRIDQPVDAADQRRLAGAGGADDRGHAAAFDGRARRL